MAESLAIAKKKGFATSPLIRAKAATFHMTFARMNTRQGFIRAKVGIKAPLFAQMKHHFHFLFVSLPPKQK